MSVKIKFYICLPGAPKHFLLGISVPSFPGLRFLRPCEVQIQNPNLYEGGTVVFHAEGGGFFFLFSFSELRDGQISFSSLYFH